MTGNKYSTRLLSTRIAINYIRAAVYTSYTLCWSGQGGVECFFARYFLRNEEKITFILAIVALKLLLGRRFLCTHLFPHFCTIRDNSDRVSFSPNQYLSSYFLKPFTYFNVFRLQFQNFFFKNFNFFHYTVIIRGKLMEM